MNDGAGDIDAVRSEVRSLLEESAAFNALPSEEQQSLAHHMVEVGHFLSRDPGWLDRSTPVRARALEGAVDDLKDRLAQKPGQVNAEFEASAVNQAADRAERFLKKVDFPAFVSGLVKGVFNAVVDASIQQMKAYGELLAATVKSLDQFAADNVTEGQARDYVANKYPAAVMVDTSGDTAKLKLRPDAGEVSLGKEFNLGKDIDLENEEDEQALVHAARIDMARGQQQLLATMVLLGINRIVVTDGKINAKVVFDISASDTAGRHATAEMHDAASSHAEASASVGIWGAKAGASSGSAHSTQVSSAVDDTSESKAQLKATLSGDVHLAFKSETFPLEKMVDAGGLATLTDRAKPGSPPADKKPATTPGAVK